MGVTLGLNISIFTCILSITIYKWHNVTIIIYTTQIFVVRTCRYNVTINFDISDCRKAVELRRTRGMLIVSKKLLTKN